MTADGSLTKEAPLATRLAEKYLRLPGGGHDGARAQRGPHRHHRHHRLHAVGHPGALRADPDADARRRRCARPGADLRHQPSHQRARRGADQRHRLACARLRRRLGRAGRSSLGARHRADLRARRAAEGIGQAGTRRLHHRRRDRGAPVARRQLPSLRQGLAPHRHARHLRRRGLGLPTCSGSTSRARPRRWRWPPRSRAGSRPTSAP